MSTPCEHLDQARAVMPSANGCEDCLRIGGDWVHLRLCMVCGHVGCCDSSPNRHATAHWHGTEHPLVRSFEPGEDWWWCYADDRLFTVPGADPAPSYDDGGT
ncbi:UBP-type zinc finger domain-containing protein [Nocardioides pantholopis]|uniref:UBP-type zinc finger domain-containing protein n=1 Tax=Nocardioides pantholopis TaxID=2483798 RepID=UPI000F085ABA|nr:UBP-type zinc finger domain-containing protein [Nocardioides pantholopis]